MEFDKSKILTVVTADQAKIGQKGWFASNVETLSRLVLEEQPKELLGFDSNNAVHAFKTAFQNHALFYPAPEPTYAERQAQWVKENNVKAGTKVRVTRTFTEDEDGSSCWGRDDLVGMTGVVREDDGITSHNLGVDMSDGSMRAVPYFALEVIKEPTYRPYSNDELNDLVGKIVVRKCDGNKMLVNESISPIKVRLGNGCTYTAKQLLELFTLNGEPCGVREEI